MIDEIRITRLYDWPNSAVEELHNQLLAQTPSGATVNTHMKKEIKVIIHEAWPKLKRERLKFSIAKVLDKCEKEEGLTARLESVEHIDRENASFEKGGDYA